MVNDRMRKIKKAYRPTLIYTRDLYNEVRYENMSK